MALKMPQKLDFMGAIEKPLCHIKWSKNGARKVRRERGGGIKRKKEQTREKPEKKREKSSRIFLEKFLSQG